MLGRRKLISSSFLNSARRYLFGNIGCNCCVVHWLYAGFDSILLRRLSTDCWADAPILAAMC